MKIALPMILYRSDRGFQESTPLAQALQAEGNRVSWKDGFYAYSLTIEALELEDDSNVESGQTTR